MKKFISILLTLSLIIAFAGCSNGNSNNDVQNNDSGNSVNTDAATENNGSGLGDIFNTSKLLVGTMKIPGKEIYFDTPELHYIESGYVHIYVENYDKYVAFVRAGNNDVATSAKDVMNYTFQRFIDGVSNCDSLYELGEITEKNTTINGIDVYSFEGEISTDNDLYEYIKGYTFVFEGLPCAIYGVVMDENQPQEDIDYISEVVDEMMKSVRNAQ